MFASKNLKIIVGMDRKFVKAQQRLRLGSLTQPRRPMASRVGLRTAARNFSVSSRAMVSARMPERGYFDVAAATYAMDTTGTITLLNPITQGASTVQRVGKKVMTHSLQIRGQANSGTTTTVSDAAFIIVYDKRPTGALPAITDILKSVSPSAFNNDDNTGRFKILRRWDNMFVGNTVTPTTGKEVMDIEEFIKINLPTVYKALGTGAIADISEGALYLVTVGGTAAGTAAPGMNAAFRTRFLDM